MKTTIIISDDQNTVEVGGEKYVATDINYDRPRLAACEYCNLKDMDKCGLIPCTPIERKDGTDVIFKLQK